MTSISNVPIITITDTGVSVPDTPSVLAGVLADYRDAFGVDLNIENVATPQGYLSQEETAKITEQNATIAYYFNGVDPAYASGRMQDGIARIYFLTRKPATYTVVTATCAGIVGYTLPKGSQAKDAAGNIYSSTADAIFDGAGEASVQFQCTIPGAIACGIGELSTIAVSVPGWDAVTNETAGVPGEESENRLQFEKRRQQAVAKNSRSETSSIIAAISDLDNVIDVWGIDNYTDATILYGETDYPIVKNSVYIAVVGGDADEIANAIWAKKSPGSNMNGNTTVTVYDESIASNNKPAYNIKFNIPSNTTVKFAVELTDNPSLPSDIVDLVKATIIAAFNGEIEGKDRERIASTIYASRYLAPIFAINSNVDVIDLFVGFGTADQSRVTMGIDQFPVVTEDDITVTLV